MEIAPGGAAPPFPPYERGVVLLDHGAVLRNLQRRESNPLLSGYEPDGSPLAFAAIKLIHPPELHRPSVRYRRTAALSLPGWSKRDTHPGLAPGKIGFADRQLVDFAMCVVEIGQVRGTCTHPAGFTGLNAAGYIIT